MTIVDEILMIAVMSAARIGTVETIGHPSTMDSVILTTKTLTIDVPGMQNRTDIAETQELTLVLPSREST
jgi:hypothetical protein